MTSAGAARSRARMSEQQRAGRHAGMCDEPADPRRRCVHAGDRPRPLGAGQRGQPHGHRPRLAAGGAQAEADDRLVAATADPVDEAEPRRHLAQRGLAAVDQLAEDVVDGVEVGPHRLQRTLDPHLRRRHPEVEVDVGVDAEQQVLEDDRPPAPGRLEGDPPAVGHRPSGPPGVERLVVAAGESGDEPLHPRRVREPAHVGALANGVGDGEVHRREVADPVAVRRTAGDERARAARSSPRTSP